MTVVGEAVYEITAKDEAMFAAFKKAEGQAKSTGDVIEKNTSRGGKGFDDTGKAASRFGGVLGGARQDAAKFGGVMKEVGSGALMGVGLGAFMAVSAGAGLLVGKIGESIGAASDLNETISKVGVVFGANAPQVLAWGQDAALSMGMSKQAALEAAGTIGNLFVSLGMAGGQAATMSTKIVSLAGDLASFNNVDPTEALEALRAGLVGETEPLRRFGVNLNEATISQKALDLGLVTSTKGVLPPAIRAQAAYALILDQTKTAQGDFARTSSGLANQQRIAAAQVEDAMAKMGQALLPLATSLLPVFTGAIVGVFEGIGGLVDLIGGFAAAIDRNLKPVLLALGIAAIAVAPALWAMAVPIVAAAAPFVALGVVIAALAVAVDQNMFGIRDIIENVFGAIQAVVKGVIGTVLNVIGTLAEAASSIPGPWQEAAGQMKQTLDIMRRDVDTWGDSTESSVRRAGDDIGAAATEAGVSAGGSWGDAIKDSAPQTAAAAQTGLVQPVKEAVAKTPAELTREAGDATIAFANTLKGGYDDVFSAADALKEAAKKPISATKRIAALEGLLAGKDLAKALKSNDPVVRAAAESLKVKANDELALLKGLATTHGETSAKNYAKGLKSEAGAAATAGGILKSAAARNMEISNAYAMGSSAGSRFAAGLSAQQNSVRISAWNLASTAQAALQVHSPAKEGPFSEAGGPEGWGVRFGKQYASGIMQGLDAFDFDRLAQPTMRFDSASTFTHEATLRVIVEDRDGGIRHAGMNVTELGDAIAGSLDATGFVRNLRHAASMG